MDLPTGHLQTLKKKKIKRTRWVKTGNRRTNSIFNNTQRRFGDPSPIFVSIKLSSNARPAVGLSVPIRIAPKTNKNSDKLAAIYKAPIIKGIKPGTRKIVPFSVFHSNMSGINPNLQSYSTNDNSSGLPNF